MGNHYTENIEMIESELAECRQSLAEPVNGDRDTLIKLGPMFVRMLEGQPRVVGATRATLYTWGEARTLGKRISNGEGTRGVPMKREDALKMEIEELEELLRETRARQRRAHV